VTQETDPDPSCAAKVDTEEEQAAVYTDVPDFGNCVAPGGKIRARKVGRARLGASRDAVRGKVGPVERSNGDRDTWCVVGGGTLTVRFGDDGADMIRTTVNGHSIRGVGPGSTADAFREAGFRDAARPNRLALHREKFDQVLRAGVVDGGVAWVKMLPAAG
jgi:hypothetical protein